MQTDWNEPPRALEPLIAHCSQVLFFNVFGCTYNSQQRGFSNVPIPASLKSVISTGGVSVSNFVCNARNGCLVTSRNPVMVTIAGTARTQLQIGSFSWTVKINPLLPSGYSER